MLSKRTVTCLSFFQTAPVAKENTEEAVAITKMENLMKAHNQALVSKKCELFAMKADMTDARMQARLKTPGLFASTASAMQKYRDLEAQIEKQERAKTLLQVDLKKLRNEEIDEELQEKAEKYMQIERVNLVSIFQFA
jgi:acyl-CoA synthetase (NDP forming)